MKNSGDLILGAFAGLLCFGVAALIVLEIYCGNSRDGSLYLPWITYHERGVKITTSDGRSFVGVTYEVDNSKIDDGKYRIKMYRNAYQWDQYITNEFFCDGYEVTPITRKWKDGVYLEAEEEKP